MTKLWAGRSGIRIPTGVNIYVSSKTPKMVLGPQAAFCSVDVGIFFPPAVKRPRRVTDRSTLHSDEVKDECSHTYTSPCMYSWSGQRKLHVHRLPSTRQYQKDASKHEKKK